MGGWYLHFAEYFDADPSHCADNESNGSAVPKRDTSRIPSRRPDPRVRGDTGEICLASPPQATPVRGEATRLLTC